MRNIDDIIKFVSHQEKVLVARQGNNVVYFSLGRNTDDSPPSEDNIKKMSVIENSLKQFTNLSTNIYYVNAWVNLKVEIIQNENIS